MELQGQQRRLCRGIVAGEGVVRRRWQGPKWVAQSPLKLEVAAAWPVVDGGGAARASGGRPWRRTGAAVLG